MTTHLKTKRASEILFIALLAVCCAAVLAPAHAQGQQAAKTKTQYQVSNLPSLGGTSSGGNSINDQSWVAGYSRLLNRNRHATLWRNSSLTDLGTLGGPNSSSVPRSEEHTSELQSLRHLVCRLLLEKKKKQK